MLHANLLQKSSSVMEEDNVSLALASKQAGNDAYKNKEFEAAIAHYQKAVDLNPSEMTFLSNLAAVRYEQKMYAECVELCAKAVEVGRDNRADYKVRKCDESRGRGNGALANAGKQC